MVVADVVADRVAEVTGAIRRCHGEASALGVVVDVTAPAQLRDLVERAVAWAGGIDIVVNNAGTSRPNSPSQGEDEFEAAWQNVLDVNLTAQARLVRCALPHLQAAESGRVVNVASTEAIVATPGVVSYSASKAAVTGLTKSLAVELGPHGIRVNCVCPGAIETELTASIPDEAKTKYARRKVPLRRYGQPEEIAHMVLNLCLPSASYVTGAVIAIDGGMTVRHI